MYNSGTLNHAQYKYFKLLTNQLYTYNYLSFCNIETFIFLATELYYYATVIILCKQYFKHILILVANNKRVVERI